MIKLESKKANYTLKAMDKIAKNFKISINKKELEKKINGEVEYYLEKQQSNSSRAKYCRDNRTPKEFIEELLTNNELEELLKLIIKSNNNVQAIHRLGNSKPATSKKDFNAVNGLPDYLIIDKNKKAYTLELQCCNLSKDVMYVKRHKIDESSNINFLLLLDTYNNKYCLINPMDVTKDNYIKKISTLGNKAGYEIPLDQDNIFDFNNECFNLLDAINYRCFANV